MGQLEHSNMNARLQTVLDGLYVRPNLEHASYFFYFWSLSSAFNFLYSIRFLLLLAYKLT